VTFRSKSIKFEEGKMEKPATPDPSTVWETSTVTEEHIQSLVDCGLLRPKSQVGWRSAAREAFPTEGTSETVVFIAHIECGFGVPVGDFLRWLLQFYRIELVHVAPNSVIIITTFIHLCEAYLDISPHFHLWRHFFELKKTGKGVVIGSVSFMLCRNMKPEYIDLVLPDNTTGWKQGWFYLDSPALALKGRMRRIPTVGPEWTNQLATLDTQELKPLLDDLEQLKAEGLTGPRWQSTSTVSYNLSRTRPIRPLNIGVNPTRPELCSARSPRRK
jgi:hypothetical protein